ncbi:MAG: hypothetical protein Q9Q13_04185 [Acidobacteriota bacterium]|nr:hypothetical protein [Acidobacteriota bacterium]
MQRRLGILISTLALVAIAAGMVFGAVPERVKVSAELVQLFENAATDTTGDATVPVVIQLREGATLPAALEGLK